MIAKRLLVTRRLRRPPREGFSWIDRRFLRDHAPGLSREAILLYFFLAAVSDQQGLSFYSDTTTAVRLRLDEPAVLRAREELLREDLIAYQRPLTQVLSLPVPARASGGGLASLGEVFRRLAEQKGGRP